MFQDFCFIRVSFVLEEEEERLYHYKIDGIRQNKRFKRESWIPYDKCTVIPD